MEMLRVRGADVQSVFTDAASATRYLHVAARGGPLHVELDAQLRLLQAEPGPRGPKRDGRAAPMASPESLRYLLPSRWCPSDRLAAMCEREFVGVDDPFARTVAIEGWIRRHLRVLPGDPRPDAVPPGGAPMRSVGEVLRRGAGTPQELAHLMISLCRASRLPARHVTTVPFGVDAPRDLHPWVEVLVDEAWLAFDPSRLVPRTALLRIGTGRDAADAPLMLGHGAVSGWRAELSIACLGTAPDALRQRDREARAICTATLGSLGEATRWHQEARLAARRGPQDEPAPAPQRDPPSRFARTAAAGARRGADVLVFPSSPSARSTGAPYGSRIEPAQEAHPK